MITHQTALIYTMVLVSAADGEMSDAELATIGEIVRTLPAFRDFDYDNLTRVAEDCAELLAADDGLETVLGIIARGLTERSRETAYVLACDVAAADLVADQEELRLLEMLRNHLDIDRLAAAAIERAARARHATA
jgi:tellurite resistance protein